MLRAGKLWMIVVVRRSYRELYMQRADPISLPPFDREANQNTRECSEANQTRVKATSLLSDPFILFPACYSIYCCQLHKKQTQQRVTTKAEYSTVQVGDDCSCLILSKVQASTDEFSKCLLTSPLKSILLKNVFSSQGYRWQRKCVTNMASGTLRK